ncbi:hypothetical protein LTR17_024050 [Elasticomyces elasticus]|nr:hypothetical protein LTR17_024050 [Elasticomyces elasticus]
MTADLPRTLKTQLICLFDGRTVEARAALFKYWDHIGTLAKEDDLRTDNRSRHAGNFQVQQQRQQDACEYIVAFVVRKEIFRELRRDTFGLRRGKLVWSGILSKADRVQIFCKKCNASRNEKGQIENVVYLSTLGPVTGPPLTWCREFFSWEDLEPNSKTGKFIEGCQTPSCLATGDTPHRVADSILAEAEGKPEHTFDGVIISFKRWKTVSGITVGKHRSKITVLEGAFFLLGIPQILYASSFMDHLGGISPSGLSSGHWLAFCRQQLSDGTLGTWQEWTGELRREASYGKGNTGGNVAVIVSRMLERKTILPQNGVAKFRRLLTDCSRAKDPIVALGTVEEGCHSRDSTSLPLLLKSVGTRTNSGIARELAESLAQYEFIELAEVRSTDFGHVAEEWWL